MKRFITIIIAILLGFNFIAAANKDSLWNGAVAAYSDARYQEAVDAFIELEKDGYKTAQLYYNIANSYFKVGGYLAKAILYYEKALKLDPSFEDAQINLELARKQTLDKIEQVPEFILLTQTKSFMRAFSADTWAYISVGLFVLVAVLLLFFRYGRMSFIRKLSFILSIVVLVFSIIAFIFSLSLKNEIESEDYAVVINPVAAVKSSPGESGKTLFVLHEGAKLEIHEKLGAWTEVSIADGKQGWIETIHYEII